MGNKIRIPVRQRVYLRDRAIKNFYRQGYSMDAIVDLSRHNPELFYGSSGLSKTTVFFAVKGRGRRKPVGKR